MRWTGGLAWAVWAWLAVAGRAGAQAKAGTVGADDLIQHTIVVVVEAPYGVSAANDLRRALAHCGCEVLAPGEVDRAGRAPDALLAVAIAADRQVTVQYWDRDGQRDSLSGAVPSRATAEQLAAAVVALGSALFERHCQELSSESLADLPRSRRAWLDGRSDRAVYALLSQLGRFGVRGRVRLRFEDF